MIRSRHNKQRGPFIHDLILFLKIQNQARFKWKMGSPEEAVLKLKSSQAV